MLVVSSRGHKQPAHAIKSTFDKSTFDGLDRECTIVEDELNFLQTFPFPRLPLAPPLPMSLRLTTRFLVTTAVLGCFLSPQARAQNVSDASPQAVGPDEGPVEGVITEPVKKLDEKVKPKAESAPKKIADNAATDTKQEANSSEESEPQTPGVY
ncbi:MAG: hypothetical protein AAFV88_15130, partial [Planctomycetota bacterium]